jgi:hypothetical protein
VEGNQPLAHLEEEPHQESQLQPNRQPQEQKLQQKQPRKVQAGEQLAGGRLNQKQELEKVPRVKQKRPLPEPRSGRPAKQNKFLKEIRK